MGLALANYPEGKGSGIKDIFERAHAAHAGEFGKMDGIDTHYAAKLVNPEMDGLPVQRVARNKRKSDAIGPQRTRTRCWRPSVGKLA